MDPLEQHFEEDISQFKRLLHRGDAPYNYERIMLRQQGKRIFSIIKGKLVPPYELEIQPSSICNLKCEHCFGKECQRIPDKIGKKEMKIIAEKVDDFKQDDLIIENVKFCGTTGEPLVNPATMYGIEIFKNINRKVFLFTNGLFLDKEVEGKKYLDYILEADKINLSLDAGSRDVFKRLKKVDGFNRITSNLEELVNKRKNNNLNIVVSYVIGTLNYDDVVPATYLIREIGANEIRFRIDFTDRENVHKLSDKIIENLHQAKELKTENFRVISMYSENGIKQDDSEFNSVGSKCFIRHLWACIGPNAELYTCGHRTKAEVKSFGSILENSFQDLWYSKDRINCVECLPDQYCDPCSPFSVKINEFMSTVYRSKETHKIFPEFPK